MTRACFRVLQSLAPWFDQKPWNPAGAWPLPDTHASGNATRVQVFVDGVLKCTQLNPIPGVQYNCYVRGSDIGPGIHVASIIATGCGGQCAKSTLFRVLEPQFSGKDVSGQPVQGQVGGQIGK
jgi:hypothetical protein